MRQQITNTAFNLLHSFVSVIELIPQLYYVMNYYKRNIIVYNEYWEYQRTITLSSTEYPINGPTFSININGSIFVTGNNVINKYDKYFNLTKKISFSGSHRGIYFNPSNQMIYVAQYDQNKISIFDMNLNLNSSVTTNSNPWFITSSEGQMVVGDNSNGKIYLYQGNLIINTVSTQCTNRVSSILFDNYNHILVLCETNSNLYIYHVNGSFTGLSMSTCTQPLFMNFDSNNRFVPK